MVLLAGANKPYIALMTSELFTARTARALFDSNKVDGIMVIHTRTTDTQEYPPGGFSSDSKCPNQQSSIYSDDGQYSCSKHQYNPTGSSLMFDNLKGPVMLLTSQDEVDRIIKCYFDHNLPGADGKPAYPLCAAELKAFMNGAGNTEICWRRNTMIRNFSPDSYCGILGGYSSVAFLAETRVPSKRNKTIAIVARSDTFSLFEATLPGTSSPVTAITVLMAVAEALKPLKNNITGAGYNVVFLVLTGESFDYIGSQKLVYDMARGAFPNYTMNATRMSLDDIDILVELSQFVERAGMYVHTDNNTAPNHPNIKSFINALKDVQTVTVAEASVGQPLPPSSAQMFIREKGVKGIPAVVLADYNEQFNTKYYNSYLDTPDIQGFSANTTDINEVDVYLTSVATTITRAVYKYTTSLDAQHIEASNDTVHSLLYCLLVTRQCELFRTVIPANSSAIIDDHTDTLPLYVSVYNAAAIYQHIQVVMSQLLAFYLGDPVSDLDSTTCIDSTQYEPSGLTWINGPLVNGTRLPMCIRSTAQYHNASSPAFEIEDYDFSSTRYSTWTESVWPGDAFRIRIFLKPSAEVQLASMVAGITIFIVTAIICVLIQKRAAILFPPHDERGTLITDANGPT